jgi:Ser-tRNA(Ala) deacylase AlaX
MGSFPHSSPVQKFDEPKEKSNIRVQTKYSFEFSVSNHITRTHTAKHLGQRALFNSATNFKKSIFAMEQKLQSTLPTVKEEPAKSIVAGRAQLLNNFRSKIKEVHAGLNIHNEPALKKMVGVFVKNVSDKNITVLSSLSPHDAYVMFRSFCEKSGVSPLHNGSK